MAKQIENNFLVALDGVKLSEAQKMKINSGIQEVVMRELANIDHTEMVIKKQISLDVSADIRNIPFRWGVVANFKNGILNVSVVNKPQTL